MTDNETISAMAIDLRQQRLDDVRRHFRWLDGDPDEARLQLIEWVENRVTSLVQALEHMAEVNRDNAAEMARTGEAVVSKVCRESADSWQRHADELWVLVDLAYNEDQDS